MRHELDMPSFLVQVLCVFLHIKNLRRRCICKTYSLGIPGTDKASHVICWYAIRSTFCSEPSAETLQHSLDDGVLGLIQHEPLQSTPQCKTEGVCYAQGTHTGYMLFKLILA